MPDMQKAAEQVMLRRRRLGLTQQELATQAGLTRNQIYLFETNKFPNIPAHALLRIAQVLGVTIEELSHGDAALGPREAD